MIEEDKPAKTWEGLINGILQQKESRKREGFSFIQWMLMGIAIIAVYIYYLHGNGWSIIDSVERTMTIIGFFTTIILIPSFLKESYDYVIDWKDIRYYKKMIKQEKKEGI